MSHLSVLLPVKTRYRGYEIDLSEFADNFREYTSGDAVTLSLVKERITQALRLFCGPTEEKSIEFKEGVNRARRRYDLSNGIIRDVTALTPPFKRISDLTFKIDNAGSYHRAVDDETGIEVFEKYFRERQSALVHDVGGFRHEIFVYRDPAYRSLRGIRDIEFYVRALAEEPKEQAIRSSKRPPKRTSDAMIPLGSRYLGFEIDSEEFDDTFREYAGGKSERLMQARARVNDAPLSLFAFPKDKIVVFRKGVNHPRRRYALFHGIVQDVTAFGSLIKTAPAPRSLRPVKTHDPWKGRLYLAVLLAMLALLIAYVTSPKVP
jgi:hypothetical protein